MADDEKKVPVRFTTEAPPHFKSRAGRIESTGQIERLPNSNYIRTIITPTGPLSIVRSVAQRLLEEGVISGDLDGALHANDAVTVKTAMMSHGVCDFCSAPGIEAVFDVPDFSMMDGDMPTDSTGGWATCPACAELIKNNRRKDLLNRAVNSLAFSKFTKGALKDLHDRFWNAMDGMQQAVILSGILGDFANDKLPEPPIKVTDRDVRVEMLAAVTEMTPEELEQAMALGVEMPSSLATKLLRAAKHIGGRNGKELLEALGAPRKPIPHDTLPHWQQALDAKVEVMQTLSGLLLDKVSTQEWFHEAIDPHDPQAVAKIAKTAQARQTFRALGFDQDLRLIKSAEVYSFNAETEAAIIEASDSIPHEAPLSSIETPVGCGWFWFGKPMDIASSPAASDYTHAMLWAWVNTLGVPEEEPSLVGHTVTTHHKTTSSLMFSAYVKDEKKGTIMKGKLLPSTRWYWPLEVSFHDMLKLNAASWRKTYGPGTSMHGDPMIISEAETLKIIANLSLFFMQACNWFRQTVPGNPKKKIDPILTQTPGHIERHARKRAQKALKSDNLPVVHVVALRRTAKVEVDPEVDGEKKSSGLRDYHCRWIVKGHNRLQACGPGRKDRKLIWIEAHPAGPEDKPLRTKTTVYAVVR